MKRKKPFRVVIPLVILLVLVSAVFAQRQEVPCDKLAEIRLAANNLLKSEPYRVRRTYETFIGADAKPTKVSKTMTEYIPPGRRHYFGRLESADKKDHYEDIEIGNDGYNKRGEAGWVKYYIADDGPPAPKAAPAVRVCFTFPNEKINGKDVKKFEEEVRSKIRLGDNEIVSFSRMIYWFSIDRHFVKTFWETDKSGSQSTRTTDVYEYDPKIKIEVPMK